MKLLKWHEEFGKFSPEHVRKPKNCDKVENVWAYNLQGSYVSWECMIMKNDAKLEEDLTCKFKIDTSTLTNFDWSTGKSKKFAL